MSQKRTEGSTFAQAHTAAANFAQEKPKRRRKPSDHIEYDVMRSNELGYGPHYGKYKADHPETLAEFEALSGPKVEKVAPPAKILRTCPNCGVKFEVSETNKNKTYCSDDCRVKAQQARAVGRGPAIHCVLCGAEIPRGSRRTRFCSDECSREADKARWRKKTGGHRDCHRLTERPPRPQQKGRKT